MAKVKNFADLGDVRGKRVLVRADLNLPITDGVVTDATRIERVVPSLKALSDKGARVIVISHRGRPKRGRDETLSLADTLPTLKRYLPGKIVHFVANSIGHQVERMIGCLGDGEILLLENLRFHPGEEANDMEFAQELARHADLYVLDAFSCAHRAHASTAAITTLLTSYVGLGMEEELDALAAVLESPQRPVAAVVGGAKVSTKMALLSNLINKVDVLIIGGGMANTFLLAQDKKIGKSLVEADMTAMAKDIMAKAAAANCRIILPSDAVITAEFKPYAESQVVSVDQVPDDQMILDVGPQTVATIKEALKSCQTLVWNGPMGAFEVPPFDQGTNQVAQAVGTEKKRGMVAVAGGGDTVSALANANALEGFSYVSTAGGAFLEWLEGQTLPGVAALEAAAKRR